MDDVATFSTCDNNSSVLIEGKEYERIIYSPKRSKQLVLCQEPVIQEDLDPIYYQYEFWNDNAYLIFTEKRKAKTSFGTFKECLYNSETKIHKIRNYVKSHNRVLSVYFHEKFYPSSFSILKDEPAFESIICNGTLKSCSPFFETYIYQLGNKLFWIIGADLKPRDEIMYHLYTPSREYLPTERVIYGNDNRGFYINTKYEIGRYGKYRLFEQTLPREYPIKKIVVGLMIDRKITRFKEINQIDNIKTNN